VRIGRREKELNLNNMAKIKDEILNQEQQSLEELDQEYQRQIEVKEADYVYGQDDGEAPLKTNEN
jgi:hypothetical protein